MRAHAVVVALAVLFSATDVSAHRQGRRPAPPVEDRRAEEPPAFEGDVVPIYLEGWVRVFVSNNDGANPTYRVIHISDGPREGAAAEAELQRIIDAGGWRIGTSFFPLHMIERFELRPYAPKP